MNETPIREPMHILLVEDDEHDRVAFSRAVRQNGTHTCRIIECHRAEKALEILQSDMPAFDLIVIDFALPGMSGMELYQSLQDKENAPPFVMLTGRGSELLAVEALKAGFADYIVKDPSQSYLALLPVVLSEVVRRHQERLARQRAEKAVADSRKRLAQTLESITDAYFALDDEWRLIEINASAERNVFGRPTAELLGHVLWELYPQTRETEFYRYYQIARDSRKPIHFEGHSAIRGKWWEVHAYPREGYLEIYLQDITDRKRFEQALIQANEQLEARVVDRTKQLTTAVQALEGEVAERKNVEKALRRSQEQYSSLVQNSLTGILIEQDGCIVFANQKAAEIYGYLKENLIGLETFHLIHPQDRDRIADITARRLEGLPVPSEYDARGITKSGDEIWIQRRNAVINYQGKSAILANHIDITKQKQAFEALEEKQRQLKFLSSRLLSAQEDERKRIAIELHDSIGSSLSAVKYRMDNLLPDLEPASATAKSLDSLRNLLQDTIEEARRLMSDLRPAMLDDLGLISTMRWFCRRFQTIYSDVAVDQLVEAIEEDVPEPLKIIMFRIMQEAFNNAAKHSRAERLLIWLRKSEVTLDLTIEDNGVGFDLDAVYATQKAETGIGLSSMKERTELSGGSFAIRSAPGKGTAIHVSWPVDPSRISPAV